MVDSQSDVIRLGSDVRGHIYIWSKADGTWILSQGKVKLPEGWYAGLTPERA
jgi:hypothetical protein